MFLVKPRGYAADKAQVASRPMPTITRVEALEAQDWKYVAEGGANVLFRLSPTAQERMASMAKSSEKVDFYGKLLRIKKCDVTPMKKRSMSRMEQDANAMKRSKCRTHRNVCKKATTRHPHYPHPQQVLEYATNDILPFLLQQLEGDDVNAMGPEDHGLSYMQVAQLIEVERAFLMNLNAQLLALEARPAHRRSSQIDVSLQCVMLLPDVTLPPPDNNPMLFFDPRLVEQRMVEEAGVKARVLARTQEGCTEASSQSSDQATDDDTGDDAELDPVDVDDHALTRQEKDSTSAFSDTLTLSSSSTERNDSDTVFALQKPMLASSEDESDDADAEEDEDDSEESDPEGSNPYRLLAAPPPRLRRELSAANRNIFDCCFRNICVEIKPKIGFKPKGPWVSDVKKNVCRFCMHQHYKKSVGRVDELSEYCPLDLFSQDPVRLRKAFRALQRTPQNNFKVFVRSNRDEVVNVITGLSTDALPKGASQSHYAYCRRKRMGFRHSCQSIGIEDDVNDAPPRPRHDHVIPEVVELMTEVLSKLRILEDLKKMQLLDHINVDGIWHLQKLLHRLEEIAYLRGHTDSTLHNLVQEIRSNPLYAENDEDVDRIGSLARCLGILNYALGEVQGQLKCIEGRTTWEDLSLIEFQTLYAELMQRFQVATTLKDCSLLLCLRRVGTADSDASEAWNAWKSTLGGSPQNRPFEHLREFEHRISFRDMEFDCIIAVVDLDVKAHKSVDDYYQLDEKIVQSFVKEVGKSAVEKEWCRED